MSQLILNGKETLFHLPFKMSFTHIWVEK